MQLTQANVMKGGLGYYLKLDIRDSTSDVAPDHAADSRKV